MTITKRKYRVKIGEEATEIFDVKIWKFNFTIRFRYFESYKRLHFTKCYYYNKASESL